MTRRTVLHCSIGEALSSFLYAQDEVATGSSSSHNDKIIYQIYVSSKKNMRKVWRIAQVRISINNRILPKKFIKDNIPFIEFRLLRFDFSKIKIIRSFLQLSRFLLNRQRIKKILNLYNLEEDVNAEKNLEAILNHIGRFKCLEY